MLMDTVQVTTVPTGRVDGGRGVARLPTIGTTSSTANDVIVRSFA
jgi:hypothetical protein